MKHHLPPQRAPLNPPQLERRGALAGALDLDLQDEVGNQALLDSLAAGLDPLDSFPHAGALNRHLGAALPGHGVVDPEGCAARGVEAFTDGLVTHFRTASPRLAVAAHEAAHQLQHAGLTCDAGLGAEGHAEAVAHQVLNGRGTSTLLGPQGESVSGRLHTYLQVPAGQLGSGSQLGWTSPDGGGLKVSDDGRLAVPDVGDGASRLAWATAEDIASANETLTRQGSAIRLQAGSGTIAGKAPDSGGQGAEQVLSRVMLTAADGSNGVALTGDCGKAAYEVMGGADDGHLGAAVVQTPTGETTTDPHPYQSRQPGQPETIGTTELWFREILRLAYGDLPVDQLMARYQAQSPEERAAFEQRWGINSAAVPRVGEAVTTMSLYDAPDWQPTAEDDFAWNWHFAACVLASGGDYITLENFTGAPEGNWYFAMRGPARYHQSFHEQELASNTFGTEAVSMVVRPEGHVRFTVSLGKDADTLGSSEIFVRMSTPGGSKESDRVSVAAGGAGTLLVPLAGLVVNGESQPIDIDVFDEDLFEDEHLLNVRWSPPFGADGYSEGGVTLTAEMVP